MLWSRGNSGALGTFSNIRVHEAEKAVAAGDWGEAERLLGEVDSFGERIESNQNLTLDAKFTGLWLARPANIELQKLYTSGGRTAEAQRASLRVQQLGERQGSLTGTFVARFVSEQTFHQAAILVRGFGIMAVLSGFAALAGILLLELWPERFRKRKTTWRRVVCWAADYAPSIALAAGGGLLLSFLPFAHAFSQFQTSASLISSQEVFGEAFNGIDVSQSYFFWRAGAVFWIWSLLTITLATAAILIVARSIYRARLKPIAT